MFFLGPWYQEQPSGGTEKRSKLGSGSEDNWKQLSLSNTVAVIPYFAVSSRQLHF